MLSREWISQGERIKRTYLAVGRFCKGTVHGLWTVLCKEGLLTLNAQFARIYLWLGIVLPYCHVTTGFMRRAFGLGSPITIPVRTVDVQWRMAVAKGQHQGRIQWDIGRERTLLGLVATMDRMTPVPY